MNESCTTWPQTTTPPPGKSLQGRCPLCADRPDEILSCQGDGLGTGPVGVLSLSQNLLAKRGGIEEMRQSTGSHLAQREAVKVRMSEPERPYRGREVPFVMLDLLRS